MVKFAIGSKVIIQNLINCPHYNGMKGTVKSDIDPQTSRQTVLLEEADKEIAVKPSNMEKEDEFVIHENGNKTRVPDKCAGCGSTENIKSCAKCHTEGYCSKECQVKHWPTHKIMCKAFSKAHKATNSMDVMKAFMGMAKSQGAAPMSRLIATSAGYINSTDTQMPQGVPENFLYINDATNRYISLGEEKRAYGEASYKKLYTDLVENEKEWMEFFSHPFNQSHSGDSAMVLEKLADTYYGREDYEACGQVIDMQEKVLDHCKRHSSVPGAAYKLMPFCEKTEFHMLSTRHSLNEKVGRHEENIPIFRKLYEYEATHDIPPQHKVNTHLWKSSASLYNVTSRQNSDINVNSIRGLSDQTILKVLMSTIETERVVRSLDPNLSKALDDHAEKMTEKDFGSRKEREERKSNVQLLACGHCGKLESSLGEFKTCNKCKQVAYCGPRCQQKHWKKHKKKCIPREKK